MLRHAPKQKIHGDYDRRWIFDDYFDLIVWYTDEDAIHGFQLCYGKPRWERALTWISNRGFSHTEIDSGEDKATRNRTPILLPDSSFPVVEVMVEFERRAADLPRDLRAFVIAKIAEFTTQPNA
jgi:hypothetical protein